MAGTAPWVVGVLVTLFVAIAGPAGILVARVQRKTSTADQKLTATDQAIDAFKALVQDLQEERDALKREKDEWRVERITLIHEVADLKRELAKRKGPSQ